jgi:guanylate kinase
LIDNENTLAQPGRLITVTGIAGAGKSTLIRNAIKTYPDKLEYLKSYTTRPRRVNEDDSEYHFVNRKQYLKLSNQSNCWNGGEIYGNHYGEDVSYYLGRLKIGRFLINCCFPSVDDLTTLYNYYSKEQIYSIYLDISKQTAADRLLHRDGERALSRIAVNNAIAPSPEFLEKVDCVIHPTNDLESNKRLFNNILEGIFNR